ncbi:hypothetical protein P4283_29080 [Bacillus thuringiensis]|nr:hypothetical protein [Bacillus thuringiensis]
MTNHLRGESEYVKKTNSKKAILVTSAAFTLGLAGIGPINVLNTSIIAHADTTSDQAIKITSNGIELLNKDVFKFNPLAANTLTKMGGQAFQDTVKAANNDGTMSVNNFARI